MINEFEDLFHYIGGFGPYQWILFAVVCYVNLIYSFCLYGQLFLSLTPPHWCNTNTDLEELHTMGFNLTVEELVHLTIPEVPHGGGYQSCIKYDINVTEVLSQGWQTPNGSWAIKECDTGWTYNFSGNYYPSITSEYNLVCNEDWKPPLAQSLFFVGSIFGGPIFGWIADNYGRLPVAISSNILSGVAGLWTAFSGGYLSFCVSRFLVGITFDTNYMVIFILGLELVATKYRTYVANLPITIFITAGLTGLPFIAIRIAHWRWLAIALSVPHLLLVILPLFFPESIRWLIDKGKYERSTKTITKISKMNGKKLSSGFYLAFQAYFENKQEDKQDIVNWWHLLKTPNLRARFILLCIMWVSIQVSYDGSVRNTETLGGNFFISFALQGLTEAPAAVINLYLVEKLGRRSTAVFFLTFSGVTSFIVAALPHEHNWYSLLTFALAARFFIIIATNCGLQYVVEVLPTVARAQGVGVSHTLGCGMTLVTPYIVYMGKYSVWAPYTIIGLISLGGGMASLFLPETKGHDLPGSLEDGEHAFKDQKFFNNPFSKESQKDTQTEKAIESGET